MKKKFRVRFNYLDIFHFSRCLGIDKVPERGNNPLGMESTHFNSERIDLMKKNLQDINCFPDGDNFINFKKLCTSTPVSCKTGSFRDYNEDDNESIHSIMSIDYTTKSLQPLNPIQRKKCLENAGVNTDLNDDLDRNPKILTKLREDRKQVGCKCSNSGKCDTSKCACSNGSIPCQSDGNKFPCKCGDKCSNISGKRVYSYEKIRFHYQHTFNRDLYSNEELSVDLLSTLTGDCITCSNISDEVWKNFPESYHQTRSRKRAGENNLENIKLFKPMTKKEVYSVKNGLLDVAAMNGHTFVRLTDFNLNQQHCVEKLNDHENITVSNDTVISRTSSIDVNNSPMKENIDFTLVKPKQNLPDYKAVAIKHLSPCCVSSKLPTAFKSPMKLQIANCSFSTPNSSSIVSNHSVISPNTYFTELDYHKSFLNQDYIEESPLFNMGNPSPVKFNPIALAPEIADCFDNQWSDMTVSLGLSSVNDVELHDNQQDSLSPNCTFVNQNKLHGLSASCDNLIDSSLTNTVAQHTIEYLQVVPSYSSRGSSDNLDHIDNSKVTNRLKLLQLTKLKSDPSSMSSVFCTDDANSKCHYPFRAARNAVNYLESPIVNFPKRKCLRAKSMKINEFPACLKAAKSTEKNFSNNQSTNPEKVVDVFRSFDEELQFFDIPFQADERELVDFDGDRADIQFPNDRIEEK